MTFDRKDFQEVLKEKAEKKKSEKVHIIQETLRAEPQMRVLTGSPEWDKYLTYLQGILEASQQHLENAEARMLDPSMWENESLVQSKMEILRLKERIETLEVAMELPKQLIETGEIVKEDFKGEIPSVETG